METISIHYSFRLTGDMEEVFHVTLDAHHLALVKIFPMSFLNGQVLSIINVLILRLMLIFIRIVS